MNYINTYNTKIMNEAGVFQGLGRAVGKMSRSGAVKGMMHTGEKLVGAPGTWRRTLTGGAASIAGYQAAEPVIDKGLRAVGVYDPQTAKAEDLSKKVSEFEKRQQASIEDINTGKYNAGVATIKNAIPAATTIAKGAGIALGGAAVVGGALYAIKAMSDALQRRHWGISKCKDIVDELEKRQCVAYNNNVALNNLNRSLSQCGQDVNCQAKIKAQITAITNQASPEQTPQPQPPQQPQQYQQPGNTVNAA